MRNIKTYALLAVSLAYSSMIQADVTDAQYNNLEYRVSALEQRKCANTMVNPSGRPQVKDGADLFFTADWLIWQAHENGLGYAVKTSASQPLSSALYNSSVKNMYFDFDSGFRVGLGWNTPHDGWDLGATWTWFLNKADRTSTVGSSSFLEPTNMYAPANEEVSGFGQAKALWRLHLNMIDLDLGREFFVSKWMTLRPFIGLRTAWIRQKETYTFSQAVAEPGSDQTGALLVGTNNYWGMGPRAGMNTQWGLGWGFSFVGNAAFSLLYGFFQVEDLQTQKFSGSSNTVVNNKDSFRVDRAISELVLGMRWDWMFADDRVHLGLQAAWEHLMFFGQNQFKQFIGTHASNVGSFVANQGDLTIQGWTISARLDF
ncbi:MAG: autotransporter outer membrane beta-barrel domain-containing protein [Chlamydiae bacterium]|nr:autotransporter outer membrane beta-barrel domain-containing protein [Chlamydiota bacterium]